MVSQLLSTIALLFVINNTSPEPLASKILSQQQYSLSDRYSNSYVNDVFSDNILLTMAYMRGDVTRSEEIQWDFIRKPFKYSLVLKPGEIFAFHDSVLEKYKNRITKTTNAHFISSEGFKSDGWLVGDGVCHLASFMYVVASQAGLLVEAPTAHDFATIADVPKEDGVSIFFSPDNTAISSVQNLYITNTKKIPVSFVFDYQNRELSISVKEQ